jgi:CheY-like chemotaxis protein
MRILVAEDTPETLTDLNGMMLALFPDAEVVLASDGETAEAEIERRVPLDIAILDTWLPYHGALQETVFLCCKIVAGSRRTLVAHVTAYEGPGFKRHLEQVHTSGYGERAFYLPKSMNWAPELKQRLAAFKVDEDLERLLAEEPERPALSSCASDLELGQFTNEVARLWRFLPEPSRRRVERYFTVEPADGSQVRVELGGRREP